MPLAGAAMSFCGKRVSSSGPLCGDLVCCHRVSSWELVVRMQAGCQRKGNPETKQKSSPDDMCSKLLDSLRKPCTSLPAPEQWHLKFKLLDFTDSYFFLGSNHGHKQNWFPEPQGPLSKLIVSCICPQEGDSSFSVDILSQCMIVEGTCQLTEALAAAKIILIPTPPLSLYLGFC